MAQSVSTGRVGRKRIARIITGPLSLAEKVASVGGQAVMEGVMMRTPKAFVTAVRTPDSSVAIHEQDWKPLWEGWKWARWPFIRGAFVLIETIYNGMSALAFSARVAGEEDEQLSDREMAITTAISVVFALGLFVFVPHFIATLFGLSTSSASFHIVDGIAKVLILLGYLWGISLIPDVKRIYRYHGAEHKSIYAYEHDAPLTVEGARPMSRFHPRCGTTFLLFVVVISIIIFAVTLKWQLTKPGWLDNLVKIAIKVPLMLPVAGISYELIRLGGKYPEAWWMKPIVTPGLWLQRLTTAEPEDDILEVGLISLKRALDIEEGRVTARTDEDFFTVSGLDSLDSAGESPSLHDESPASGTPVAAP